MLAILLLTAALQFSHGTSMDRVDGQEAMKQTDVIMSERLRILFENGAISDFRDEVRTECQRDRTLRCSFVEDLSIWHACANLHCYNCLPSPSLAQAAGRPIGADVGELSRPIEVGTHAPRQRHQPECPTRGVYGTTSRRTWFHANQLIYVAD